jgi:negative regulator of genetic competence, sporulation and motility
VQIERLNQNQIRFTLDAGDLNKWNLSLADLGFSSEKNSALFFDMMRQAHELYDFDVDDVALMVEVVPTVTNGGVHITITQSSGGSGLPKNQPVERKHVFRPPHERFTPYSFYKTEAETEAPYFVFITAFNTLDDAIHAAQALCPQAHLPFYDKALYKLNGVYYLHLDGMPPGTETFKIRTREYRAYLKLSQRILDVLSEYGVPVSTLDEGYLKEYGEVIIHHDAVERLRDVGYAKKRRMK